MHRHYAYKRKIPAKTQIIENPIAPTIPRIQHTEKGDPKKSDRLLIPVMTYNVLVP